MNTIKTAISLKEPLFQRADALARELNVSRSRLFALAIEQLLERYDTLALLQNLNDAYQDSPTEEEALILEAMSRLQIELIGEETW